MTANSLDHRRRPRRAAQARDLGRRSDHVLPDRDRCGRRAERLCPQDARDSRWSRRVRPMRGWLPAMPPRCAASRWASRICSAPRACRRRPRRTSCSGFKPEYESTVTTKLFGAGAVMLGKLNMDEFAMGSSNETSCYGNAVNPWKVDDRTLTPGGSSGGSAAAVAADLCLAATGTDTGGSIRQPAAFTGIIGIKPTYGRVSRWGIVAFASSSGSGRADDQIGARCGDHAECDVPGMTRRTSTSADIPVPDFEAALTGDIRGKMIGIPREYRMDGMPAEIEALWQNGIAMLRDAGAEIVDISLPHTKYALPAYYVIAPAEASSNLARYDGVRYGHRATLAAGDGITEMYEKTRAEGFGPEVQRRDHGRHLCAVGGLLRRLLQPRPQGARADQARFRDGLCRGRRCDPDPRDAIRGLRSGRDGRCRPGRDVSERCLHRHGQPCRPARHRGAGRAGCARACRWGCN